MFRINLDIEQHVKTLLENSQGDLRAIASLQYPICCIHATILDSTPDELEKLDKAILEVIKDNLIDSMSIASILGVSKRSIEYRLTKMQNEGFVTDESTITIEGALFISEGSEKRFLRKDIDIYLDGTNNKLLSKELTMSYSSNFISEEYYNIVTRDNGETSIHRPFAPDLVHEPIIEYTIKKTIESLNEDERTKYGISLGLEKIESISYTLLTLPLLISLSDNGKPIKQITNGLSPSGDNQPIIEIKRTLESKVQGLLIQLKPNSIDKPIIYTNWFEIDNNDFGQDRLFHFTEEDFKTLLRIEYGIINLKDENINCGKNELSINITKSNLDHISDKKTIIKNIIRGRDYLHRNPLYNGVWKLFISFKTTDELVQEMCDIYSVYTEYNYSPPIELLLKIKEEMKGNFRRILIYLEMHHIMEKIDMNSFMFDPNQV